LVAFDSRWQLDGLLFYHKEAHYTFDHTPLVGWLKAYMLPEILNIQSIPQSILNTAPSDYKNIQNTITSSTKHIQRFKAFLSKAYTSTHQMEVDQDDIEIDQTQSEFLPSGLLDTNKVEQ
jgi:hypothetical protein